MDCLEEMNIEIEKELSDEELMEQLKRVMNINVFRTRDEVISKLSNEVMALKMREYDFERIFEKLSKVEFLDVKSRILYLLAASANDSPLKFKDIKKKIVTSKSWLEKSIKTLMKNGFVGYNPDDESYFLIF